MIVDKRYIHIYKGSYVRKSLILILTGFMALISLMIFWLILPRSIISLVPLIGSISAFTIFAAAPSHYAFEVFPNEYEKLRCYINLYGSLHVRKSYLLALLGVLVFVLFILLLYYLLDLHSLNYFFQLLLVTLLSVSIFSAIALLPGYSGLEIDETLEKNLNPYSTGLERLKFLSIVMILNILIGLIYIFFRTDVFEIYLVVLSLLSLVLMFVTFSSIKNIDERYAVGLTGVKCLIGSILLFLVGLLGIMFGLIIFGFIFLALGILLVIGGTICIGISIHRIGLDLKSSYFVVGSIMTIVPVLDFFGWILVFVGTKQSKMHST